MLAFLKRWKASRKLNVIINLVYPLVLIVSVVSVLVHTFKSRSIEDILKYSFYIDVIILPFWLIFAIKDLFDAKFVWASVKPFLFQFFSVVSIGPFWYGTVISIKDSYLWLLNPNISRVAATWLFVLLTLGIAIFLFWFRLRYRSSYGLTEMALAIYIAADKVFSQLSQGKIDSSFFVAFITASIYLLVRGLDNVHQGIGKTKKDPVANFLDRFSQGWARL